MKSIAARYMPLALVVLGSVLVSLSTLVIGADPHPLGPGDYPHDAGPPIDALTHLDLSAYLSAHYVMGPFSLLLRAPFAAFGAGDPVAEFRLGTFPCILAGGLLGLYLARLARHRGCGLLAASLIAALCLFNPLSMEVLWTGHPEEILTAALAIGAVAVAARGNGASAALLLGLAIASKQWAVIAVLPTLMAMPSRRLPVAIGAAAVVAILTGPSIVADPKVFADVQGNIAFGHRFIGAWSAWYPFAGARPGELVTGPHGVTVTPFEGGSAFIGRYSHPLVVLLAVALPLALVARRRRFGLGGAEAMMLLALLALLRCALDPSGNAYYHVPFLFALAGWDAFAARGLPLRAMLAAAIALALSRWVMQMDPAAFNALYLALVVPTMAAIAWALWRPAPARARAPRAQRLRLPRRPEAGKSTAQPSAATAG